jgi:hypothetical protein
MKQRFVLVVAAMLGCEGAHRAHDVDAGSEDGGVDAAVEIEASNESSTGGLMSTGLVVNPPDGTFNTSSDCTETSSLGRCSVVARLGLAEACVCRMDELTIGSLEITGARALVILAYESVRIETKLDLSAEHQRQGPGAAVVYTTFPTMTGGAGGSFGTRGAGGGAGDEVANAVGDPALVPLHGGMQGQSAGDLPGGGGGALQITAGDSIEVVGQIQAGGGGGKGGVVNVSSSGGGGGGSGGAILLEAPSVVVTGMLNANGGGGGGGGSVMSFGTQGTDADDGAYPVGGNGGAAVSCPSGGPVLSGGNGGHGATSMFAATKGAARLSDPSCSTPVFVGGGGGGGGLGRIRINTIGGCECSGPMSPSPSLGTLGVKQ